MILDLRFNDARIFVFCFPLENKKQISQASYKS